MASSAPCGVERLTCFHDLRSCILGAECRELPRRKKGMQLLARRGPPEAGYKNKVCKRTLWTRSSSLCAILSQPQTGHRQIMSLSFYLRFCHHHIIIAILLKQGSQLCRPSNPALMPGQDHHRHDNRIIGSQTHSVS